MSNRHGRWPLRVVAGAIGLAVVWCCACGMKQAAYDRAAPEPMQAPAELGRAEEAEHEYAGEEAADAAKSAQLPSVLITEAAAATAQRQIIYNASLTLETKNTADVRRKIETLAGEMGGFVSDSESWAGQAGQQHVSLTIRVPANRFTEVLAQIRALGKLTHESIDGRDVTEEFLDLDARLRTLRQAEERLLAMLRRSGKLADLLAIERELATRREQIEKAEGRLRYLRDQVGFSTITVSLYEEGTAAVAPSGPYDIAYHLRSAYRLLILILQGILTALIYLVIDGAVVWIPVIALIWLLARRQRARRQRQH